MVKVLLFLVGLAILLVSSRQVFLMFRAGSFRVSRSAFHAQEPIIRVMRDADLQAMVR